MPITNADPGFRRTRLSAGSPAPARPQAPAAPSDAPMLAGDRMAWSTNRRQGGWSAETAQAYSAFVKGEVERLVAEGAEVDCSDLAALLLKNFSERHGVANPLAGEGTWHVYTPKRNGGLPNVQGPNYFLSKVNADNLAKAYSRAINDANGNGLRGFDPATGAVDVGDLMPGDLLFYDWDHDGEVNHTVNVLDVAADGTVTAAFGTYNNLKPGKPLTWDALDLQPITILTLKPGTEDYQKWLGAGNDLHSVNRFRSLPDALALRPLSPAKPAAPVAVEPPQSTTPSAPAAAAEPERPKRKGLFQWLAGMFGF